MTRATLKTKYEPTAQAASTTVSVGFGDIKLKASCTDRTLEHGFLNNHGVSVGLEKPGCFMIDYDVPKQAARFQFMNSAKVFGKPVKLTYIHPQKANATVVEGTISLDPSNKLTGKYSFLTGKGSVKYSYEHGSGVTVEPAYDFHSEAWSFAASQKLFEDNTLKLTYETSKKVAGLEWTKESKDTGCFKVTCILPTEDYKNPKIAFEKTWNLEL